MRDVQNRLRSKKSGSPAEAAANHSIKRTRAWVCECCSAEGGEEKQEKMAADDQRETSDLGLYGAGLPCGPVCDASGGLGGLLRSLATVTAFSYS